MPRGPVSVKLGEINRIARGLKRAGYDLQRVEVEGGKAVFFPFNGAPVELPARPPRPRARTMTPAKIA